MISIVIPAYNVERRIESGLASVAQYIATLRDWRNVEVLIVDDGSRDRTLEIAMDYATRLPWLRVLHADHLGKGFAVKFGMLAAKGDYRMMCDVDFSMPACCIDDFVQLARQFPVVIGSREAPGAQRSNEPQLRHVTGKAFNWLVRWLVMENVSDTQCGFKCFQDQAARDLFGRQTLYSMAFDVEILYLARRLGYPVVELGVPWAHDRDSRVRVGLHSLEMAVDLVRIRKNAALGVYDRQPAGKPVVI
jgi:glycosyltransferase involved in cell wall biosynthesis